MFKALTALHADAPMNDLELLPTFQPCLAHEAMSSGWVPPSDQQSELFIDASQFKLLKFRIEKKSVPSSVLKKEVKAQAEKLATEQGYAVGRRQMKDVKAESLDALLEKAFAVESDTAVIYDRVTGLVFIDSASKAVVELIVTSLQRQLMAQKDAGLLSHAFSQAKRSPDTVMTQWMKDDHPAYITLDDEADLTVGDSLIRYQNRELATSEILEHLGAGMICTRLAITWNDRLSFVWRADGSLSRISTVGVSSEKTEGESEAFMAGSVLRDLIESLSEECEVPK